MKKLLKKKLRVKEYSLDLSEWNGPSDENVEDYKCIRIMKRGLWARFCQDKRFREMSQSHLPSLNTTKSLVASQVKFQFGVVISLLRWQKNGE